jgi:putative ABC transport system permease protein
MSSTPLLGHYALTLYRTLTRQRLYAALNILGLAVGIAVFLVLWLDVRFETSFEQWLPHADQIYALRTSFPVDHGEIPVTNSTMGGLRELLTTDYPQLLATRVLGQTATVEQGPRVISEKLQAVDPNFFQVFELPLVSGSYASALAEPDDIVISQRRARKYFGAADPMGRQMIVSIGGVARTYRVSAVLKDPPAATDNPTDMVVRYLPAMGALNPFWNDWGSQNAQTYVRLATPEAARALDSQLDGFLLRHAGPRYANPAHPQIRIRTQPLLSLHLIDPKDAAVVAGLGAVGLLTLLLAGVNYVNLATARAALRAREVALRKVMGANQGQLAAQFIGEALATAVIAAVIAVAICEIAVPLIDAGGGLALKIRYLGAGSVIPPLLAVVALLGLGAGVYPALVLARFQPAAVLASARTPGGGRGGARIREALVATQFAIAVAFTIATAVILTETHYLRHVDLGFRRDGLVIVTSFNDAAVTAAQRQSLLAAWRALPGVTAAGAADIAPGDDNDTSVSGVSLPNARGPQPAINIVQTGPDFFRAYGARLIAGRFLDRAHGGDDAPPANAMILDPKLIPAAPPNVVINASAVKALGFPRAAAAVGRPLRAGTRSPRTIVVAGVIDDLRFRTPHEPTPPTLYAMTTQDFDSADAAVRFTGADPRTIMARMGADWRSIAPKAEFRAATVAESLKPYYAPDDEHGRLFSLGAGLAVIIACVGLYGLAAFSTARRIKEIGIRKTLGASTADVLTLMIGQFLRPVLLANLVAWPLAWLAMRGWLAGFAQRITLSPVYFLAATLLTLLIAIGTVAGQAWGVARAEPAKALRHE